MHLLLLDFLSAFVRLETRIIGDPTFQQPCRPNSLTHDPIIPYPDCFFGFFMQILGRLIGMPKSFSLLSIISIELNFDEFIFDKLGYYYACIRYTRFRCLLISLSHRWTLWCLRLKMRGILVRTLNLSKHLSLFILYFGRCKIILVNVICACVSGMMWHVTRDNQTCVRILGCLYQLRQFYFKCRGLFPRLHLLLLSNTYFIHRCHFHVIFQVFHLILVTFL